MDQPLPDGRRDLQLEVFVNGTSTELVAAFRLEPDGSLAIQPDQLRNVGLVPVETALQSDGLVDVSLLPGVTFVYDEGTQSIHFTVSSEARAARVLNAGMSVVRVFETDGGLI